MVHTKGKLPLPFTLMGFNSLIPSNFLPFTSFHFTYVIFQSMLQHVCQLENVAITVFFLISIIILFIYGAEIHSLDECILEAPHSNSLTGSNSHNMGDASMF